MRKARFAAVPVALVLAWMATVSASAGQYVVKPGDTLWGIAHGQRVSLSALIAANPRLVNPDRIFPGQQVTVPDPPAPSAPAATAPAPAPRGPHGAAARAIITRHALQHGLNPNFALALSWWESGWSQDAISATGAVGLMQIEPYTASSAGPALLGRKVNIADAEDNADLGVMLLRHYLDVFNGDPKLALAAYYQGETATHKHGVYPSSQRYVDGIWALRNRFQAGHYPA